MKKRTAAFAEAAKKAGFQKGKSGNPKGRPKNAKTIPDIFRELASAKQKGVDALTFTCKQIVALAKQGSVAHINIWFDRMEGKPVERVLKQQSTDEIVLNPRHADTD